MAWVLVVGVLGLLVVVLFAREPLTEYRRRRHERERERKRQWRRDRAEAAAARRTERAMNPARAAARRGAPRWQQVAQRSGSKCWLCGTRTFPDDRRRVGSGAEQFGATYPAVDFIVPIERGGTYELDNARVVHRHCHALRIADGGRENYGSPRRTYPPSAAG
jgi:5-methylcytosine-specific restriction endonuclease McrA